MKKLTRTVETIVDVDKLSFRIYKSDISEVVDGYQVFPNFIEVTLSDTSNFYTTTKKASEVLTKTQENQLDKILERIVNSLGLVDS